MIYIVTSGEYSDYGICGCFDKKETAQAYIDALQKTQWDTYEIEEYELNNTFSTQPFWFVRMDKTGKVLEIKQEGIVGLRTGFATSFDWRDNLEGGIGADDEMGAAKIMNERRAILIAQNRWGKKIR